MKVQKKSSGEVIEVPDAHAINVLLRQGSYIQVEEPSKPEPKEAPVVEQVKPIAAPKKKTKKKKSR